MIIIGAGGHGREILDSLINNNYKNQISFFDDDTSIYDIYNKYKVVHNETEILNILNSEPDFCIAVGNPVLRKSLADKFETLGGKLVSVIDKSVSIGLNNNIETGVNFMNGVVITNSTKIGKGVLINTLASIHHDVTIGEFTEISPGARILGGVKIGKLCRIGANACVLPNVKIGDNVIIGAGAVVTNDLPDNCTAMGVPAKIKK